jgi:predicted rRNA methylase YqxC with S4 and FtsJ domains
MTNRTDQAPQDNPHLTSALAGVEAELTRLFQQRADAQDLIKDKQAEMAELFRLKEAEIADVTARIDVAEDAKKYLRRALLESNEAARYLGGGTS